MTFKRRLGADPHADGRLTPFVSNCPDIWELESGDFAIIGRDDTDRLAGHLPQTASCGPDERIVIIPRQTLLRAKADIPEA